jgi:hypothetical protein
VRKANDDPRCRFGYLPRQLPDRAHFRRWQTGNHRFHPVSQAWGHIQAIRDLAFFREFHVNEELGTLTWGDEIDIAPETLYAAATGAPLPDWMTKEEPSASERPELVLAGGN